MLDQNGTPKRPLVTGHRGAAGVHPENTLAAFSYAAEIGCDGVELDVHLSRDGVPVVLHDPELRPAAGRPTPVASLTADEVTALKLEGGGQVPTLAAVLELLEPTGLYVQAELKGEDAEGPVVQMLRRYGYEARAILTSFVHERVLTAKQMLPSVRTGVLLSSVPVRLLEVAQHAYADNVHLDHRRVTPKIVEQVHDAGKAIVAWGVIKDDQQFDRLFALGVDMIGSDWPDRLLRRRTLYFANS